jgi:hypothetical protein
MKARDIFLQIVRAVGACIGYAFLAAFLWLVGAQIYSWFRTGDWTHIGVSEGLRTVLVRCCVKNGNNGHIAALLHWLDTPVDWLGMHKVLEVLPASLALFAVSILGNCISIYCRDRIDEHRRGE